MVVVLAAAGAVVLALLCGLAGLVVRRRAHEGDAAALWSRLIAHHGDGRRFEPGMLEGLPGAARRWLRHAIAPSTPLARSAELRMHGTLRLKDGAEPLPMQAEQVLAPPMGFVWRARVGRGLLRIRGHDRFDGAARLRWWLLGLIPLVSAGGVHAARSAAGRLAGESVLLPSSLLPGGRITWEAIDESAARVRFPIHGEAVEFTVHVSNAGRLERVVIRRWNGDPANGDVGYLPFVVDFEGERRFGGYTIAAKLSARWAGEGAALNAFFVAELDHVKYR